MKVVIINCFFFFSHFTLCFIYLLTQSWSDSCSGLNNLLMAYEDKSAYALCAFSFSHGPGAEPLTFLGKTPVCSLLFFSYQTFCSICLVILEFLYLLIVDISIDISFLLIC